MRLQTLSGGMVPSKREFSWSMILFAVVILFAAAKTWEWLLNLYDTVMLNYWNAG